jgi:hypothetical protein
VDNGVLRVLEQITARLFSAANLHPLMTGVVVADRIIRRVVWLVLPRAAFPLKRVFERPCPWLPLRNCGCGRGRPSGRPFVVVKRLLQGHAVDAPVV